MPVFKGWEAANSIALSRASDLEIEMPNIWNAKAGDTVTLGAEGRHPEEVKVIDVGDPNQANERNIRFEKKDGRRVTNRVRSDGTVSYWNINDE